MSDLNTFPVNGSGPGLLKKCTALTGGIATGKSTVAEILKKLGAGIADTDAIAREIVLPGGPVIQKIIDAFGTEYLREDGSLNRAMMRDTIISSGKKRLLLNSITHPAIMEVTLEKIKGYLEDDSGPVIADVPLLYETGWDRYFRETVLVYVPEAVQVERLMKRDLLDRDRAAAMVSAQMNIEKKREKSKIVIDNSGPMESTMKQVKDLYAYLEKQRKKY